MPSTRGDIDLDGQWTTTVQGDRFLLGEDGNRADTIIAFASNSALHALANADTYHMDGTFATAPKLFYQIVTLHAFVLGVMPPLVFGLLPNKDGNTYICSWSDATTCVWSAPQQRWEHLHLFLE